MGLLDSLLEVPERLRVWQMAGVRHFYLDPEAVLAAGETAAPESGPVDDAALAAPTDVAEQVEPAVERPSMAPSAPTAPETLEASPDVAAVPAPASCG